MKKALILGVGNCKERRICEDGQAKDFADVELFTVDIDPNCEPDLVLDMEYTCTCMPFEYQDFDEIHSYDTLEHWGVQGDWRGYFDEFSEYHRILKPGGRMYIIVPHNADYFADPGHKRFFGTNHFKMLDQDFYEECHKNKIPCTDYRFYWKKDFKVVYAQVSDSHIAVVLEAA